MGALDTIIGLSVVFIFGYLIYMKLKKKYPKLEGVVKFNPTDVVQTIKNKEEEVFRQTWRQDRSML